MMQMTKLILYKAWKRKYLLIFDWGWQNKNYNNECKLNAIKANTVYDNTGDIHVLILNSD